MSIFPTKVLLATDGSRDAELARTTAVDLANSVNSELHLLTVAPGYPSYDVRNPYVVAQLLMGFIGVVLFFLKKRGAFGRPISENSNSTHSL